eukprot:tig00000523_g1843.t1
MQLQAGFLTRSFALLALRESEGSTSGRSADWTPRAIQVGLAGAAMLDLLNLGRIRLASSGRSISKTAKLSPQILIPARGESSTGVAFLDSALSIIGDMPTASTLHDCILELGGSTASAGVRFVDMVVEALIKEGFFEQRIDRGSRCKMLLLRDTVSIQDLNSRIWNSIHGEESPLVMIVLALCKSARVDSRGRNLLGKVPGYNQDRALFTRRIKPFLNGVVVNAVRTCVVRAHAMDDEAAGCYPRGRGQRLVRAIRRHSDTAVRVAKNLLRGAFSCKRRPASVPPGPSFARLPAAPTPEPEDPRQADPFWSWSLDLRDVPPCGPSVSRLSSAED